MRGEVSPTSSMKTLPRCARSSNPTRSRYAPVKLPRACPNSSLSSSVSAMAAQFTVTSGHCARRLFVCTSRETSSFPTPLSPEINTLASLRAANAMLSRSATTEGAVPRMEGSSIMAPGGGKPKVYAQLPPLAAHIRSDLPRHGGSAAALRLLLVLKDADDVLAALAGS